MDAAAAAHYMRSMASPPSSRVAALHRLLVETEDDGLRAEAHVELAQLAMERRRVDLAIRHLREALLLDPDQEMARRWLRRLGGSSTPSPETPPGGSNPSPLRALLGRLGRLWRS
jgi:hypothetical protein